ncbi:MAG: hypothetical protein MMC33_005117 [Icmadophila ericetorum]|nr:hypothetical protein [Icmadophila ericetorum]
MSGISTILYEASKTVDTLQLTSETEGSYVADVFHESIKGKTILITGVSLGGLGATMTAILAAQEPSLLILTGRSVEKTEALAKEINANHPEVKTRVLKLDLASLAAMEKAAREVLSYSEPCIDILINNAGVMNVPDRIVTDDGYELHLQTNFISPFKFTCKVMPKILASKSGRIVNIVSNTYILSPVRFSDLNFTGKNVAMHEIPNKEVCALMGILPFPTYIPQVAFAHSKSAVVLGTKVLADKLRGRVTVLFASPGIMDMDFYKGVHFPYAQSFNGPKTRTRNQGAATVLLAALDPNLAETYTSNQYLEDCYLKDMKSFANPQISAEKLWDLFGEESPVWDTTFIAQLHSPAPVPVSKEAEEAEPNFEDLYTLADYLGNKESLATDEDETMEVPPETTKPAEPPSHTLWFLQYPPPPPPAPTSTPAAQATKPTKPLQSNPSHAQTQTQAHPNPSEHITSYQNSPIESEPPRETKKFALASRITRMDGGSSQKGQALPKRVLNIRGRAGREGERSGKRR